MGEMQKLGWRFMREKHVLWDNRDYGGYHAFYCKGNYTGDLEYAGGLEENFGWTYSLAISWGMTDPDVTCR